MPSMRLRTTFFVTLATASAISAVVACSENPDDEAQPSTTAAEVRNDGKEDNASNPGKVSCEDHNFDGIETDVDLGGVNRTVDLGGGNSCTVSGVKKGKEWHFDFNSDIPISLVLIRSGNKVSTAMISPPSKWGTVTRDDAWGETKPGLNRIAFCFEKKKYPPPPHKYDAGPPKPPHNYDAGPPKPPKPKPDGGNAW